jgi:hypothetical protein
MTAMTKRTARSALVLAAAVLLSSGCQSTPGADPVAGPVTVTATVTPIPEVSNGAAPVEASNGVAETTPPANPGIDENWRTAVGLVGRDTTICGPIASVIDSSGHTFVNIGVDYPDPSRFTFYISANSFAQADAGLVGRTACGSGEVVLYRGLPQIALGSLDDLSY